MSSQRLRRTSVCAFCSSGCGLKVSVRGSTIRRVSGDPAHPVTRGRLCIKGACAPGIVHSPERLRTPMLKSKGGFREVSWKHALDWLCEKIHAISARYGPESLALFRGHIPGPETLDAFSLLWACLGSPNYTGVGHLCHIPSFLAFHSVYGLFPYPVGYARPDFEKAGCIVVWGANPSRDTRFSPAVEMIPKAGKRGARLVVIDPVGTPLAKAADLWLQILPGTDYALAAALIRLVMENDLFDADFVGRWTTGFDALRESVAACTPQWAAAITGVPPGQIETLARWYAEEGPAAIETGNGLDQHVNVFQTVRGIAMLISICGYLDVPGGNCFFPFAGLKPYPGIPAAAERTGAKRFPLFPGAPFPAVSEELTGNSGRIRGMLVYHGNPCLSLANEKRIREALGNLELLVVCDIFPTATTELADLVLPGTTAFERTGLKTYSIRDGGYVSLRKPAIRPLHESRPWYEIEYEIASRLGFRDQYPWKDGDSFVEHRLQGSGVDPAALGEAPSLKAAPGLAYEKFREHGFQTETGRVELFSEKLEKLGYAPLPDWGALCGKSAEAGAADPKRALIGTTRRPGVYIHTRYRNVPGLRRREPEALAQISPADAEAEEIRTGDRVRVSSAEGSVRMRARVSTDIRQGVVVLDFGWGNPGDGGENANRLTSDREVDPAAASTSNRRFWCTLCRE